MIKNYFNFKAQVFTLVALSIFAIGCGGEEPTENQIEAPIDLESSDAQLMEINGKVFSIPSPIQTAMLVKSAGTNYNKDILNEPSRVTNYSTNFKKAINLGVYGADLGYVTMYDQTQDAISFLTAVKSIADDLGVSSAFDLELVERFENNIATTDMTAEGHTKESIEHELLLEVMAGRQKFMHHIQSHAPFRGA